MSALINEAAAILLTSAPNICCGVEECSTLTHHTNPPYNVDEKCDEEIKEIQTTVWVNDVDNKLFLGVVPGGSHLHVCGEDVLSGPGDCFPAARREQHPSP